MRSLHKNIQLLLESFKTPFLPQYFSFYSLMTFLMMLSVILLSMLLILRPTISVICAVRFVAATRIDFLYTRNCGLGQEVVR